LNSLHLHALTRQTTALSPRMQHAVKLLQMSSMDFAQSIRDVLARNPFLEAGEDGDAAEAVEPAPQTPAAADAGGEASDRELWHSEVGGGLRRAHDGESSAMELMAVQPSLSASLHTQINVLPLPERDRALARTLIESLDDDGYLRTPLDELLGVPGLAPPPSLQEMEIALRRVQALEPAGIAARTVAECLLLQMPAIACPEQRALATTIVRDHLEALAARDLKQLAQRLGASVAEVEAACDRIRRLDPRPGWRLGPAPMDYIVPDLTVHKLRGRWTVQLNPAVVPRLRLNQVYAALFQRHRTPQHDEMGNHLQEARWTLRNMEQRFTTIMDVAEAIVKRQASFLDYGPMAMKPLCLSDIAQEVGLHESTVCRVTNNKYIATPSGVFELKYFFSRPMMSASGQACSGTAIRGLVKSLLDAEDPVRPLSDAEIARMLAAQGLAIARRTVTKYRQTMKIEPAERRRRHAQAVAA
jgi:RNA polymerase sigma-54 factor